MGDYSGGEVVCYNERRDKKVTLNTRNNPIMFDGRLLHKVNMVTEGPRFHHVTYKHYEESSLTQDEFPVYDLAEFHPDSEEVNVLERDGYWVPNSEGLQELEDYVKFLFEARTGRMKQKFNEQLRLTYLFKKEKMKLERTLTDLYWGKFISHQVLFLQSPKMLLIICTKSIQMFMPICIHMVSYSEQRDVRGNQCI